MLPHPGLLLLLRRHEIRPVQVHLHHGRIPAFMIDQFKKVRILIHLPDIRILEGLHRHHSGAAAQKLMLIDLYIQVINLIDDPLHGRVGIINSRPHGLFMHPVYRIPVGDGHQRTAHRLRRFIELLHRQGKAHQMRFALVGDHAIHHQGHHLLRLQVPGDLLLTCRHQDGQPYEP